MPASSSGAARGGDDDAGRRPAAGPHGAVGWATWEARRRGGPCEAARPGGHERCPLLLRKRLAEELEAGGLELRASGPASSHRSSAWTFLAIQRVPLAVVLDARSRDAGGRAPGPAGGGGGDQGRRRCRAPAGHGRRPRDRGAGLCAAVRGASGSAASRAATSGRTLRMSGFPP